MNQADPVTTRRRLLAAAAVASSLPTRAPYAQDAAFPSRPIRFVVPYPPGGGNDDVARLLAEPLGRGLGQPVVIDNRPGASGMLAGEYLARSAPDGYTIMIDHTGIVMNPSLFARTPFDLLKDLAPVIQLVRLTNFMVAHPSLPARNAADLIALAKAQPGKINYSSPGIGSPQHIDMEVFRKAAGIDIVHVPYRGGAPATTATLANEVQMMFSGTTALPHIRGGTLRALGTTGATRSPLAPDVPTIAEAGLPGYESYSWMGIFVPAGTPAPIIERLRAEFAKALGQPDLQARLQDRNMEAAPGSSEDFARTVADDLARYARILHELGIKAE